MKATSVLLALTTLFAFAGSALAEDYTHSTPAVQGYDVVSYQTGKRPARGNGHFVATHDGATYIFSSKSNLETFNADPERYVPAYNGFCAFGVSVGKKFIADPEIYRVVDNRLYLNLDATIQDDWLKDVSGRIDTANTQWRKIKDVNPKSL